MTTTAITTTIAITAVATITTTIAITTASCTVLIYSHWLWRIYNILVTFAIHSYMPLLLSYYTLFHCNMYALYTIILLYTIIHSGMRYCRHAALDI